MSKHSDYSRRLLVVEIKRHLAEVQALFIALLSDPKCKQISRESCCLGVAACRGLTGIGSGGEYDGGCDTEELNNRLLRAFGQTTSYGGSAYQETTEQAAQRRATDRGEAGFALMDPFGEESEVGGASGLGESALTSYKEMAAGKCC